LSAFERWLIWLTSAVTTVTGTAYLWMKYFMDPAQQWSVINHPLQPWMLKAHILAAPLLVFALGAIVLKHVPHHLRAEGRPRLVSGMVVLVATAVMIASGYLVQVVTHEGWLLAAALFHIGSSFLYVGAIAVHSVRRRAVVTRSQPVPLSVVRAAPTRRAERATKRAMG
jgi:hypothetical protein